MRKCKRKVSCKGKQIMKVVTMNMLDEYRLSEYQDLGELNENKKVHLVRNRLNGRICVRKDLAPELYDIYVALKYNQTAYTPYIYEIIQDGESMIIVEEYFDGENLQDALGNHIFTEMEVEKIILDLCKCLKALHDMNPPIICRDLKPQNIIRTNRKEIKLIDFDIARAYQPGKRQDTVIMGTEGYAAPEQFGFGQTDARTDIYGLGVLWNYLLIQKFPTEQIAYGKYTDIIQKCTQINPKDRYQNVTEVKEALKKVSGLKEDDEKDKSRTTTKRSMENYKIPGFRTDTWWKKIVAITGYLLITLFCFTSEFKDENGIVLDIVTQRINQVAIWMSQMAFIFFLFDYRKIQSKIPNFKKSIQMRVLWCVVIYILFVVIAACVCTIIENIFL